MSVCVHRCSYYIALYTEGEDAAVPEHPQVIVYATFQGVPKSPPRITRLNELVRLSAIQYITVISSLTAKLLEVCLNTADHRKAHRVSTAH